MCPISRTTVPPVPRDRADATADALLATWRNLMAAHPDAWMETGGGLQACITGIPSPGLNGVWATRRDPDPAELERLLDAVVGRGLPHLLQLRPGAGAEVLDVPERRGMTPDDDVPLMRLDDAGRIAGAPVPHGLVIRQLDPDEAALHARTAAAGFGEKPEHFLRLVLPEVLRSSGSRAYVGEASGEIVTTALGVTLGDHVGVFNVGTPDAHRRRGYGTAITARVVADGLDAGANWAWLQSSNVGYPIYEALGFETVERWSCWVRP